MVVTSTTTVIVGWLCFIPFCNGIEHCGKIETKWHISFTLLLFLVTFIDNYEVINDYISSLNYYSVILLYYL